MVFIPAYLPEANEDKLEDLRLELEINLSDFSSALDKFI